MDLTQLNTTYENCEDQKEGYHLRTCFEHGDETSIDLQQTIPFHFYNLYKHASRHYKLIVTKLTDLFQ